MQNTEEKRNASELVADEHKAGILLVGNVKTATGEKLHVVAPWAEGAFHDKDKRKAYMLPKGTIDNHNPEHYADRLEKALAEGNQPEANAVYWAVAKQELKEETGIDLDRIYNPHNPNQKEPAGGFYDGVIMDQLLQTPIFDANIPSNRGNPKHTRMFLVKVDGIEQLQDRLKHREHSEPKDRKTKISAQEYAKEKDLPRFSELLEVLRDGKWDDTQLWPKEDSEWAIIEQANDTRVTRPEDFDAIYSALDHESLKPLKEQFDRLKGHMCKRGLIGDEQGLKLGNKHLPLRYYMEGADVISYESWIDRMIDYAKDNPAYRDIQFNEDFLNQTTNKLEEVMGGHSYGSAALAMGKGIEVAREEQQKELGAEQVVYADTIDTESVERGVSEQARAVREGRGA